LDSSLRFTVNSDNTSNAIPVASNPGPRLGRRLDGTSHLGPLLSVMPLSYLLPPYTYLLQPTFPSYHPRNTSNLVPPVHRTPCLLTTSYFLPRTSYIVSATSYLIPPMCYLYLLPHTTYVLPPSSYHLCATPHPHPYNHVHIQIHAPCPFPVSVPLLVPVPILLSSPHPPTATAGARMLEGSDIRQTLPQTLPQTLHMHPCLRPHLRVACGPALTSPSTCARACYAYLLPLPSSLLPPTAYPIQPTLLNTSNLVPHTSYPLPRTLHPLPRSFSIYTPNV